MTHRLRHLPLIVKAPIIVALLMLAVSSAVSMQVLSCLSETQLRNLEDLTTAYLDGLSSSLLPHVLRDDTWEIFDNLERSRALYQSLRVKTAIVVRPDMTIMASTDPTAFPTESILPAAVLNVSSPIDILSPASLAQTRQSWVRRDLKFQDRPLGTIFAHFDTAHLRQERQAVLTTLFLTNAALTTILMAAGWWLVRRMMRPVRALAVQLESGASGTLRLFSTAEIGNPTSEFGRLFKHYNAMAQAVSEREALMARFAEEERLASLGRLSSVIAHEINNPLGGLLNAVDTIKRHGDTASVRSVSVGLLERGLNSIREVVETTLAIYRPERNRRPLRPSDIDDLQLLVDGAAKRRDVRLTWTNRLSRACSLPSGPIRQIILNLVVNAIQAVPANGEVSLDVSCEHVSLLVTVTDTGPGLPAVTLSTLTASALATTPETRDGIGAWMVNKLVKELDGALYVRSGKIIGTTVHIVFPIPSVQEIQGVA